MRDAFAAAVVLAAAPLPAAARADVSVGAAAVSDHRARGLSWSDGRAAARARIDAALPSGLEASAQAITTRGAERHGGADAAFDVRAGYAASAGLLQWHAGATAHLFSGARDGRDYVELDLGAGVAFGPVDLSLRADYAPPQDAIGGSNLHVRAQARAALIGTPLTVTAHLGRSTGSRRDGMRANRLRPGGAYRDWRLGADYAAGPLTFGLAYSDTDIGRSAAPSHRHSGATVVASARISL